jgi:hypothetical protein
LNLDPDSTPVRALVRDGSGRETIEHIILEFPNDFPDPAIRDAARWRLEQADFDFDAED